MAPHKNRRPGFSRRIQLGLFIGYVIAVIGMVCGLTIAIISRLDPAGYAQIRSLAIDAGAPITGAGRSLVRGSQNFEQGIKDYLFAASQNRALKDELAVARRELIGARIMARENMRLKRTLNLVQNRQEPVVTARLIGSTIASARRFATLSAGWRNGVRPGQPVISADGLVGRILETGDGASRVLLLTDGESAVPVRLARNGTPALARGRGDGALIVRSLLPGAAPFRRGDLVTTSGTGGIYPPNIPVAVIRKVDGDSAVATALASPDELDFAIVLKPFQPALPSANPTVP